MKPFILKQAKKIPSQKSPTSGCIYDPEKQFWIEPKTGIPLVLSNFVNTSTRFGETVMTETQECADQSEITLFIPNFTGN